MCFLLQEARALLGRYEYQKGNIEAALHVFEGIDIAAITPKIKITLSVNGETNRRRSQNYAAPPMSIHAVSLLFEAVFLKAKSLQALGRYKGISSISFCLITCSILEIMVYYWTLLKIIWCFHWFGSVRTHLVWCMPFSVPIMRCEFAEYFELKGSAILLIKETGAVNF